MTFDEFMEMEEVHSECECDWYENPEWNDDSSGHCPNCGSDYTLVSYDPGPRTTMFECYDCGSLWDEMGCTRD
jgi:hypothetical protein